MRWLLLLLYPMLHVALWGGVWWFHARHQDQYYAGGELVSVAHVIVYVVVAPFLVKRLMVLSAARLAGFAVLAAVAGVAASWVLALIWSALHPVALWPWLHDTSFFVVVPFVAPLLGIFLAARLVR